MYNYIGTQKKTNKIHLIKIKFTMLNREFRNHPLMTCKYVL